MPEPWIIRVLEAKPKEPASKSGAHSRGESLMRVIVLVVLGASLLVSLCVGSLVLLGAALGGWAEPTAAQRAEDAELLRQLLLYGAMSILIGALVALRSVVRSIVALPLAVLVVVIQVLGVASTSGPPDPGVYPGTF